MTHTNPHQYLQNAELIHSEESVLHAIAKVAAELNSTYSKEPPVVLCVMGGGVVFTGLLLPKLTFPLHFDYVQASRYHGTHGADLIWTIKPKSNIQNQHVLILDDILDEGITLHAIVEECMRLGAQSVRTAVLIDKVISHSKPLKADYVGLQVPDRYVFGCGMDVYGWWRNLPAIYALDCK